MTEETKKSLNTLSDEEYNNVKESGRNKLLQLASGEIVINRNKDYLLSLKKEIQKVVKAGYTFAEIAKVLEDEERGIKFSTKQIRDFCKENGIIKADKKTSSKKIGLNKDNSSKEENQNDEVIPTGNRKRPKAEV